MKDCDFIPADYHQARTLHRAVRTRAAMIATLLCLMGIWVVAHQREVASAQAMLADVAAQRNQVDIHLALREQMEKQRQGLLDQRRLLDHLAGETRLVAVLSDISRRLPETVVLTDLNAQLPGMEVFARLPAAPGTPPPAATAGPAPVAAQAPTPATPRPARLTLGGVAAAAPEVIRLAAGLEDSPLIDRVQMQSQQTSRWAGRVVEKFVLTCDLAEQRSAAR
jgi:hypothetical protein